MIVLLYMAKVKRFQEVIKVHHLTEFIIGVVFVGVPDLTGWASHKRA